LPKVFFSSPEWFGQRVSAQSAQVGQPSIRQKQK